MNTFTEDTKFGPQTMSEDLLAQIAGGLDYEMNPPSSTDLFSAPVLQDMGPSFQRIDLL